MLDQKKRWKEISFHGKKAVYLILALLLFYFAFPLNPANQSLAAEPSITISVTVGSQQEWKQEVSLSKIAAIGMVRQSYTSLDASGFPEVIYAEGIPLDRLMAVLGCQIDDMDNIHFESSDGWSRSYTKAYLYDTPRYRYGALGQGTAAEATPISALLSLKSFTKRLDAGGSTIEKAEDWNSLNQEEGVKICFGQKAPDEQCSLNFGRRIHKMDIKLKNGSNWNEKDVQLKESAENSLENDDSRNQGADSSVKEQKALPEQLTIKVGYFGQDYQTKKVFTLKDLQEMPKKKLAYTFIDNMPSVVMESAKGVLLSDILKEAGVDPNSIETLYFYCTDVKSTWYESMSRTYLLDTKRYYYPNLVNCWDQELQASTVGAEKGAIEVPPMIVLEDNWERFGKNPDYSDLTDESRFRLVFGQTDTNTKTAYRSAKWIHSIEIMLGGKAPEEKGTDDQLKGMVGSTYRDRETPAEGNGKGTALPSDHQEARGKIVELKKGEDGKREKGTDAGHYEEDAGLQKWRAYEMSEGASALKNADKDNPMLPVILVALPSDLLLGGVLRFLLFKKMI